MFRSSLLEAVHWPAARPERAPLLWGWSGPESWVQSRKGSRPAATCQHQHFQQPPPPRLPLSLVCVKDYGINLRRVLIDSRQYLTQLRSDCSHLGLDYTHVLFAAPTGSAQSRMGWPGFTRSLTRQPRTESNSNSLNSSATAPSKYRRTQNMPSRRSHCIFCKNVVSRFFLLFRLNFCSFVYFFLPSGDRARLRQRFLFSTNASGWSFTA